MDAVLNKFLDWLFSQGVSTVILFALLYILGRALKWWGENFWIPTKEALQRHLKVVDVRLAEQSKAMHKQATHMEKQTEVLDEIRKEIKKQPEE